MAADQAPTQLFRDTWLPPVESPADLPRTASPEAMCFVAGERRVWVWLDGAWTPVGPARQKD